MRLFTLLSICTFSLACNTPTELLQKGDADQAFKKAVKKIKRDKDVMTNTSVLVEAGDQISENTIYRNQSLIHSSQLKYWTRAQKNYDKSLRELFAANDLVHGELQGSYDKLCSEKIELDFQIVDHFYKLGEDLLATHYEQTSKHHAREAYYKYKESLSYGGDRFFQDIEDKIEESIIEGRTLYVSHDFDPSSSLFFKALPVESTQIPDCEIYADFGRTHFSESSCTFSKSYSKEIEVGQSVRVDTAGVKHYFPIYEKVMGRVITKTITIEARNRSYINVDNLTGHCFKSDAYFSNSASDSYEIVKFSGDHRAIPSCYSEGKKGNPYTIRSSLKREVDRKLDNNIFHW